MFQRHFKVGDSVIYRKLKHSTRPGPRAKDVHPAPSGDAYTYWVDKFWVVQKSTDDGQLVLQTRGGKCHTVRPDCPHLRRAYWWERLWYRAKFPQLEEMAAAG